jgi:hypothetical protein
MTGSQYDAWLASQIDQAAREEETDPRERVQPADETQEEEWQEFLGHQGEDAWEAHWSDSAWWARLDKSALQNLT